MNKYFKTHILGWVGAVLVLIGYFLNANMNPISWLVWILGNTVIGVYCLNKQAYPTAVMSFALVIINVYGYIRWLDF